MVRADPAVQGVGVLPGRVDPQRTVLAGDLRQTAAVHRHAVNVGDHGTRWRNIIRQHIPGGALAHACHAVDMILQDVQRVGRQRGDPRRRIEQEQVLAGGQIQRQLRGGAAQQRRAQPAGFNAHLLEGLRRIVELIDVEVEHRGQRHAAHGRLNGHGAGGAFFYGVDDRVGQIVQQVQPQRIAKVDPHQGKAALRRGAVVNRLHGGIEGQRGGIVHGHDTAAAGAFAQRQHQICRGAGAVVGDGVGKVLRAPNDGGAGVGQVIGIAAVQVDGQRAVLPLNHRAVSRDAGGGALGVGDRGDGGARRGVVAACGWVHVGDDVPDNTGLAGHGACAGLFHRHIEAGVRAGCQQVSVVAQDAILTIRQAGQVQRHPRRAEGQQVSELRLSGVDHGGPGVVGGVKALYHQLKGIEQGKNGPRGVGVHGNIRTAAAADGETYLRGVVAEQRQHVTYGAHQQETIVAVLRVGHRCGGCQRQLFNVGAG